ncbi:MAG: hypothetical protein LC650_00065 [Actinobacteria bacterium]|nr:hypothetical protein [Actinomycetota bacterium]
MELAETVGKLHVQGKSETEIGRELGVPRKEVVVALADFRALLRKGAESGSDVREHLLDILFEADNSFRMVIQRAWETVDQADSTGQTGAKINALKLVESSTKNRADMLQKSGITQDDEVLAELEETERRQEILINVLKKVKEQYPEAAGLIAKELTKVQAEVETIAIEAESSG